MNTILILLSPIIDRDKLIKALEEENISGMWFYSFPNSLFITTNLNAGQISKFIEKKFGQQVHFVTQIESDYFGRMDVEQWNYFKKSKYY